MEKTHRDRLPPTNIYLLTIKTLEKLCEICSQLTIKTPDVVFIVNFDHIISNLFLLFLLIL